MSLPKELFFFFFEHKLNHFISHLTNGGNLNISYLPKELDHLKIPLDSIKLATNNFAQDNFLGQGGFGRVYRGQLLVSNTTRAVAVKRLDTKHGQGQKEFLMEIFMLSSYKHANLVSLIGFCDQDGEKLLVYEQEVHGSLDNYLASQDLTWEQRLRICLGAARGLDYLHSGVGEGHRVIHRDIKSSNILLDDKWEAKISDFGLSKIGPTNQEFTYIISSVAGTYGYVDPMYSFGIVLFEVACQRLAMIKEYDDDRKFLSGLVNRHYISAKLHLIVPADLRKQMTLNSYTTFCDIALQCVKKVPKQRPTMRSVVKALETALKHQQDGSIITHRQIGTRSKLLGSNTGGLPWLFQLGSNRKLRKITLYAADCILSLAFTAEDSNGLFHSSPQYGGGLYGYNNNRGKKIEINFDADEEIISLTGSIGKHVSSMSIMTTKKKYGTFGTERKADNFFSDSWGAGSFDGFYGRSGWVIDAVGCCLKPTTI